MDAAQQTKFALVTGANKGIGRAISLELAARGFHLLLVARGESELNALAADVRSRFGVEANYLVQDLTLPDAAAATADWAIRQSPAISVLVNNAGYGLWGEFRQLDLHEQLQLVQLNVAAVLSLTHHLLPALSRPPKAYILNVASTAAYQAVPTLTVYAASKAFVLSFSRGLRYELRRSSVSVSCLCPGPTATGFATRAGLDALADLADKFNMPADRVAKSAVRGMLKGKAEIIPGVLNRVTTTMVSFLPKSFIEWITGRLYRI